jgi:glycosyltransferase involved in cell wall biosynthesis
VGEFVSALVCTRDRPESLVRTVRSLLRTDGDAFELIVVDQSAGAESERATAPFASDPRFRHVRFAARGKGAALNHGLSLARGEIVVCTDDDCEAPPGWVSQMAQTLKEQPSAAVLFCNVHPVPYDRAAGYVPAYERKSSRLVKSVAATCAGHGIGAGMALRRDAVLELGGFDEAIGPGAPFLAGDDWDIANRALLRGWHVYETADVSIVHDGFRSFAQGREHARRDWYGMGAVCAKPLRAGHVSIVIPAVWVFALDAVWPPLADLLKLRKPRGLTRIVAFLQGFARGLRTPIDPKKLVYLPRD